MTWSNLNERPRGREPLSRRRRFAILKRDKFTCQYCGGRAPDVELHVDHALAVANGGSSEDENLVTSCVDCNIGKAADLLPMSFTMARTEAGIPPEWVDMVGSVIAGEAYIIAGKLAAIRRYLLAMGLERTVEAAELSRLKFGQTDRGFRYFCGVCNQWIKVWKSEPPSDDPRNSQNDPQAPAVE